MSLRPREELCMERAHSALACDELHTVAFLHEHVSDGVLQPLYEPMAKRIAKSDMHYDGGDFEEANGAYALRAVDDMRWQRNVRGRISSHREPIALNPRKAHA